MSFGKDLKKGLNDFKKVWGLVAVGVCVGGSAPAEPPPALRTHTLSECNNALVDRGMRLSVTAQPLTCI